jgi:hypothetical protein
LQDYLSNNFEQVYDFFTHQKHAELLASRDKLNRYIQLNRNVILKGTSKNINLIFFFNRQSLPTEADSDLNLNCIELLGC